MVILGSFISFYYDLLNTKNKNKNSLKNYKNKIITVFYKHLLKHKKYILEIILNLNYVFF